MGGWMGVACWGLFELENILRAGYGDTASVQVEASTRVPRGWVIVAQRCDGPRIYTPHWPTRCFMTLKDVRGAPLGAEEEILGQSPIPPGWVVVKVRGAEGTDGAHYNLKFRIRKTEDRPLGGRS